MLAFRFMRAVMPLNTIRTKGNSKECVKYLLLHLFRYISNFLLILIFLYLLFSFFIIQFLFYRLMLLSSFKAILVQFIIFILLWALQLNDLTLISLQLFWVFFNTLMIINIDNVLILFMSLIDSICLAFIISDLLFKANLLFS